MQIFLLYILFISKKSYLQHRQSESIINLNFLQKVLCGSPKNMFFASSRKPSTRFCVQILFYFFCQTKRSKIMKNCTRKIKWMLVFLPNLQLITYSLRFIKYFCLHFKKSTIILMLLCVFYSNLFLSPAIVSPKTKGDLSQHKSEVNSKMQPSKTNSTGDSGSKLFDKEIAKTLNYSLNQLEGLNLNCDWFQYIYIIVIMGFVSYLSFSRLLLSFLSFHFIS